VADLGRNGGDVPYPGDNQDSERDPRNLVEAPGGRPRHLIAETAASMTSLAVVIVPPVAVMMANASDEPGRRLRAGARHPKPAIGARGCPQSLANGGKASH
jgi:hypothetical protein